MAQRLIRRLCPHCSETVAVEAAQQSALIQSAIRSLQEQCPGLEPGPPALREARGCDACLHTGYLGRVAVYELFDVTEDIRRHIRPDCDESELIALLRSQGVRSMRQDGLLKAWDGTTTVEEALSTG